MLPRRPLLAERQFGKGLRVGGAVKLGSLRVESIANTAVNQNVLSGVLSSDTYGNFPLQMHELVVRGGPPLVVELGQK
jgi:hypothetical protein